MSASYLGSSTSPQGFEKWAKKNSIFMHPDVAFFAATKTMGLGAFATRALPAGTVVISCPEASGVSPYMKDVATSPAAAALHTSKEVTADGVLFDALFLMAELCRRKSTWRPWLEVCPRMDAHLFNLSTLQRMGLQGADGTSSLGIEVTGLSSGTQLPDAAAPCFSLASLTGIAQALEEVRVLRRWAAAQPIITAAPDIWPPEQATFELFCECLAQVFSRNFHREELPGREGPYLFPGLDVLNHSFAENTKFEIRGGGRQHATAFTVVTTRPLRAGEQVYGNYGRIGAARFAVEFQFLTPAVLRNDLVRLSASSLTTMAVILHGLRCCPPEEHSDGAAVHRRMDAVAVGPASLVAWEALTGSAAAGTATLEDVKMRTERLQRLGLLFDEGLYLVRPYATWEAEASTGEAAKLFSFSSEVGHKTEIATQRRLLRVVVYLLMVDREKFDDLHRRVSRDWEAPDTPDVTGLVGEFLGIKLCAARRQLELVDQLLDTDAEAHNGARIKMVKEVLSSEIETLQFYAQ